MVNGKLGADESGWDHVIAQGEGGRGQRGCFEIENVEVWLWGINDVVSVRGGIGWAGGVY